MRRSVIVVAVIVQITQAHTKNDPEYHQHGKSNYKRIAHIPTEHSYKKDDETCQDNELTQEAALQAD